MQRALLTPWTILLIVCAIASIPSRIPAQTLAANPPAAMQTPANLNQLMRGVLYPASNVVFSAQTDNPADVKSTPGEDPSMAVNPLASTFGGWQAVENAALALTESANLLLIPGRTCSNGVPAPLDDPDWAKFVQDLRDAGTQAYSAAQSKDQDRMIDVADTLATACAGCHRKWRERRTAADRCK